MEILKYILKLDKVVKIKIGVIVLICLFLIIGTLFLIISDEKKSRDAKMEKFQQDYLRKLIEQQANQAADPGYTEEDFEEAKKQLPPVEEVNFDE